MPRCLLVKKYYGSKRPNLSELGCQNDILSEQYPLEELVAANTSLPVACFTTGLVWDFSLVQSLQVSTALSPLSTTQGPVDLSSPSNCTSRDEDDPPSPEPVVTYRTQHQKAPCDSKSNQWAKKDQGEVPVPITAPSFLCKHCSKQYNSLGALKMHIRSHIMPCVCPTCGKAFSRPWLLRGHIRTHTGERPFSCTHCNRAFADRSNLRAHLQTHVDVKKYQCSTCSRTFSRMSLLQKHKVAGCCPLTV